MLAISPKLVVNSDGGAIVAERPPMTGARLVTALPTNQTGPVPLLAATLLVDADGSLVSDVSGTAIGTPALWCHRLLYARRTEDTRGL